MNLHALLALYLAASVATGPQTTYVFPTPGQKTVSLTVCNSSGCSTATKTLTVLDPKPALSALNVPLRVGSAEASVRLTAALTGRPPVTSTWTITSPLNTTTVLGNPVAWTPQALGSHLVQLRASNSSGLAFAGPVAVSVVPSTFSDVPPTYWAWSSIELIAAHSLTSGCGANAFCPELNVSRAQMAVFLELASRGAHFTPPPATGLFADVARTSPFAPFIEQFFRDGITAGCGAVPLLYCPSDPVTRAQMAIFLLRAKYGPAYAPPPATGRVFNDVPAGSFGAAYIERIAAEGIAAGCGGGAYCPGAPINRAQLAVFLAHTFSLTHRPMPSHFRAVSCESTTCSFPAGLPLSFALRVSGGLAAAYDYDWAGDGTYEDTSAYPVEFHTYSLPGTYSPRIRLRAGSWTSPVITHPPILIRLPNSSQAPSVPSSLAATYANTVAPTPLEPGSLWRTSFALRATAQRQSGFLVFRSVSGSPYRPVAVLPADLSRPLLLPFMPPGSTANIYLVAFNSSAFSLASPSLSVTAP